MSAVAILDENVSLDVEPVLTSLGFEVVAVALLPDRGLSDTAVFDLARQRHAFLITRDRDFTNPIRFPPNQVQAILYLTDGNLRGSEEAALVKRFLDVHSHDSFRGRLVTLSPHTTRIR